MGELLQYPLNLGSDVTTKMLHLVGILTLLVLLGTLLLVGSIPTNNTLISP